MGTPQAILWNLAAWGLLGAARALIAAKSPLCGRMVEQGLNDGLRCALVFGPLVWCWAARLVGVGVTV